MKVKDLIKVLSQYDTESEVEVIFNPCSENVSDEFDVRSKLEVMGNPETSPTIIVVPETKSTPPFETLTELMHENPKTIRIEIEKTGMYVFADNELRRELDFNLEYRDSEIGEKYPEYIKRLIEIM